MNWEIFWLVVIAVPVGSIAYAAGSVFAGWIRDRYGSMALLIAAIAQLVFLALLLGWAAA